MRKPIAVLTALALVAIASTSSSLPPGKGPPDPRDPPPPREPRDPPPPREPPPPQIACAGWPCKVTPYEGNPIWAGDPEKMAKLGCEKPFKHRGGIQRGETGWIGYSCPASVASQFAALPPDFSDPCLPKRAGRVYVPVARSSCNIEPAKVEIADAKKLGCGPAFTYSTGGDMYPTYTGTYCPDTKAVREATKPSVGFPAGYCDGCLDVPAGKIFKIWSHSVGPNCPSGCPSGGPSAM